MKLLRLVPDGTKLNFIGAHRFTFLFSAILILGSLVSLFTQGLNFGIDFRGGTAIEIRTEQAVDLQILRDGLTKLDIGEVNVQTFGTDRDILIRLGLQLGDDKAQAEATDKAREALVEILNGDVEIRKVDAVGPQVGEELKKQGLLAVALALGAILFYVWIRFEWQYGIAAIGGLVHDIITTLGFFSVLQLEFNLATVAAVLTVAGYSINDTVVVFDRVRETLRRFKTLSIPEVLNLSLNQTLSRTIVTSATTLIALLALFIFGGSVIQSFTIALIWGVVVGTYSTIAIAVPTLLKLDLNRSTLEGVDQEVNQAS